MPTQENNSPLIPFQITDKDTLILNWNCSSFLANYDIIKNAIDVFSPDIITLQETRVKEIVKLPNISRYNLYHNYEMKENRAKRGLMIIIKQSIPHTVIENNKDDHITDYMGIEFTDAYNRVNTLFNVYVTNKNKFSQPHLFRKQHNIIVGDFNARHTSWCNKTNQAGRHLIQLLENHNCVTLNDGSITTRFGTAIDLAITNNYNCANISWGTFDYWFNDHIGQIILLHDKRLAQPNQDEMMWRVNKANWKEYEEDLDTNIAHLLEPQYQQDTDDFLHDIISIIEKTAAAHIPKTKTKRNPHRKWRLNEESAQWHYQISRCTKAFKQNPSEHTLSELRSLQRDARDALKQNKNQALDEWAQSLNTMSTKELWKEVSKLKGRKVMTQHSNPRNIAEQLAKDFTTRGNKEYLPQETQQDLDILAEERETAVRQNIRYTDELDANITMLELNKALDVKKKTSPGEDHLPYIFFRHTREITRSVFLKFFNTIWNSSFWPSKWKLAEMVPIPKPSGDGMRPISLLDCFGKIYERILYKRLAYKLPDLDTAYVFVEGRGTVDAIVTFVDLVTSARRQNRNKHVVAVFFDLSKAFERARRLPLLEALINVGIKGKLLAILDSWISNRSAYVKLQGIKSNTHGLQCGVPQGSILSPIVFNVLVHVLINNVEPVKGVQVITYADDIVAIANQSQPYQSIQKYINQLQQSASKLGFMFAPNKTAAMAFHSRSAVQPLYINDIPIQFRKTYKYLGILIDRKLSFMPYACYIKDKIATRFNILRILGGITRADTHLIRKLFIAIIQPIIEYAAPVLIMANKSAIETIERAQRKALRLVLNLPTWTRIDLIYAEANILPFSIKVDSILSKYLFTAQIKPHPCNSALQTYNDIKDERALVPKSWRLKASFIIKELDMPQLIATPVYKWQPWKEPPFLHVLHTGCSKNQDIEQICSTVMHLLNNHPFKNNTYYTDASLHADGKASWGVYTPDETCMGGRINNFTPITLAEMVAISKALEHAIQNNKFNIIVATDSKSAIQSLLQYDKPIYRELTNNIFRLSHYIEKKGYKPVIIWVPSHVGIEGNEIADQIANDMVNAEYIEPIETPKSIILGNIRKHFQHVWHQSLQIKANVNDKLKWYLETTTLPNDTYNKFDINKRHEIAIRKLRCGIYEYKRYMHNFWNCVYCNGNFNIVHYIVGCPAVNSIIHSNLLQLLTDEQHGLTAYHKAMNILYQSPHTNPEPLIELLETYPVELPQDFPFDTG